MDLRMRFKTKSQIIIFIKNQGGEFAELVRKSYNDHALVDGRIRPSKNFKDVLVAFKSISKDVLEDVVNEVIRSEEEEDFDTDEYGDEEEDADADESEDDDNDDEED